MTRCENVNANALSHVVTADGQFDVGEGGTFERLRLLGHYGVMLCVDKQKSNIVQVVLLVKIRPTILKLSHCIHKTKCICEAQQ